MFHAKIAFNEVNGQFASYSTTLTQGGNTVSMGCDNPSNNAMTEDMKHMAVILSNWGGDASWLWKDACYGTCGSPNLTFQNIAVTTGGSGPSPPYVPPVPPTGDFTYGDACGTKSDDECDGSCNCLWSWPSSDPAQWDSPDAHCRCKY